MFDKRCIDPRKKLILFRKITNNFIKLFKIHLYFEIYFYSYINVTD